MDNLKSKLWYCLMLSLPVASYLIYVYRDAASTIKLVFAFFALLAIGMAVWYLIYFVLFQAIFSSSDVPLDKQKTE